MVNYNQVFSILIKAQIFMLVLGHSIRYKPDRPFRIKDSSERVTELFPQQSSPEVRILPNPYRGTTSELSATSSSSEEEESELDDLSRLPAEIIESLLPPNSNIPVDDTKGNTPINREVPPIAVPPRNPIFPNAEVNNGLYTDISRVQAIDNYLDSRILQQNMPQFAPLPRNAVRPEQMPPPRPFEDLRADILNGLRPGGSIPLVNRNRWFVYFGQVFLQAIHTLIDGTRVALKETAAPGRP